MKQGELVFQGTSKKGTPFILRYPKSDDGHDMWEYINTLSKEKTFIRFQGEEISLEDEQKYLEGLLKRISECKDATLLVYINNQLMGISGIGMKDKIESHIGEFGISLRAKVRGEGIGKILMEKVIEEAKKNLQNLKIIVLGVFSNNPLAINMYQNFGFKEYGRLPSGVKYKGEFVDHIEMYFEV